MKRINRGFSLLELLVVIGVIALLAAIVMAVLRNASNKSQDARTKQVLANVRNSATEELVQNNSYVPVCSGTGKTATVITNLASQQKLASSGYTCVASSNEFAVVFPLESEPNTYWCVDASGNAMSTGGAAFTNAPYNCKNLPTAGSGAPAPAATVSTPVLTLQGSSTTTEDPRFFEEPSYTATDAVDGNITNKVSFNTVFVSSVKSDKWHYQCTARRTYSVSNNQGRSAEAVRVFTYLVTNIEEPLCRTELSPYGL